MRGKTILFTLIVAVAASFAQAADDDAPVMDQWTLTCVPVGSGPDECGVYWITLLQRDRVPTMVGAALGSGPAGQVFGIVAEDDLCPIPNSTIRIDGYPAEPLQMTDMELAIPESSFEENVARLDAGTMLFLRLHFEPDCAPSELAIPLPGFSEAWANMPK